MRAHRAGLVHGACHTYIGQEAVAAGVCAHLGGADAVFSTHRGHGHALALGVSPAELIAELFGRATGISAGRGGSMHLFAPSVGLMGTSGIVGPSILQAAGAGYTFQLLETGGVGVAFFGDGAVNNGAFHEGLNLASIWSLPVVFVCENNEYATEVPFSYASGNPSVAARGEVYGLPGVEVDGNDVLAVSSATAEAVRRARAGEGPTLVECKTYRTRPHAEGMADYGYRTREEVAAWRARDPIERLRSAIAAEDEAANSALESIDAEIEAEVRGAIAFAEGSPWPDAGAASTFVFAPGARVSAAPPAVPAAGRELTFMQATHEALDREMARDPRIFVLGEGIGKRGGNFASTLGLYDKYGEQRLRDTPISERGFVGLGIGAAMTGSRPVIDFMFADFVLDAVGELLQQAAKIQYMSSGRLAMPILLRGAIGIGHSAATHHSGSYYSLFAHVPGLRVVVPSTPYDAKGLFLRALRSDDPVIFLEHREILVSKGPVPEEDYEIEFGRARVLRAGRDLTVVALARMAHLALDAARQLAERRIDVEVIDPRCVAPLDTTTILASLEKTGRILVVDEAFAPFGVGAEIAARLVAEGFDHLDAPIHRLNGAQAPTPYSPELEAAVVPDVPAIVAAIERLMEE